MWENLAAEARRLRKEEGLSVRQIQQRLGVTRHRLYEWLRGTPAPEWTNRPNAKDDLRARAERLRRDGWSVPEIAVELGVAKSTAFQWTRQIALDPDLERSRQRRERSKRMTDARWQAHREDRDRRHAEAHERAKAAVGGLDDRDLLLLGAAIYWSEGSKSKPWRRDYKVVLVNSDPALLATFLWFLASVGIDRSGLKYRLSIHESADPDAALSWWVEVLDLPRERFYPSSLKRHRPQTQRHNTGDDYHGCLTIYVPRSRATYWLLEGVMKEVGRAAMHDLANRAR
jgi:transposase